MIQAPVLLLHGFLGTAEDWGVTLHIPIPWFEQFGAASTLFEVADFFYDFYSAQYSSVTLVGYSMGGRLALILAEKYPKWVTGLVLLSASPGGLSPEVSAQREIQEKKWQALMQDDWKQFLEKWYQQPLFSVFYKSREFQSFLEKKSKSPIELWAKKITDFSVRHQDSRPYFFSQKLDYRVGEFDLVYRKIAQELRLKNEKARVSILAGYDHRILDF